MQDACDPTHEGLSQKRTGGDSKGGSGAPGQSSQFAQDGATSGAGDGQSSLPAGNDPVSHDHHEATESTQCSKKHGKWCRFKQHLPFVKKHPKDARTTSDKSAETGKGAATEECSAPECTTPSDDEPSALSNTASAPQPTKDQDSAASIGGAEGTSGRNGALSTPTPTRTRKPAGLPSVRAGISARGKEAIRQEQAEHERQIREQEQRWPQEHAEEVRALKRQKAAEKKRLKELERECKRKAKEKKRQLKRKNKCFFKF